MMLNIYENMARIVRIRFRSWKDLVLIFAAAVVIFALQWVMKKFMPNIPDKAVSVISYGIGFVIIVVGIFAVGD